MHIYVLTIKLGLGQYATADAETILSVSYEKGRHGWVMTDLKDGGKYSNLLLLHMIIVFLI